jgi:hypothetical protein
MYIEEAFQSKRMCRGIYVTTVKLRVNLPICVLLELNPCAYMHRRKGT